MDETYCKRYVLTREDGAITAAIPAPRPSVQERLRTDVDFIAAMTEVSL